MRHKCEATKAVCIERAAVYCHFQCWFYCYGRAALICILCAILRFSVTRFFSLFCFLLSRFNLIKKFISTYKTMTRFISYSTELRRNVTPKLFPYITAWRTKSVAHSNRNDEEHNDEAHIAV